MFVNWLLGIFRNILGQYTMTTHGYTQDGYGQIP